MQTSRYYSPCYDTATQTTTTTEGDHNAETKTKRRLNWAPARLSVALHHSSLHEDKISAPDHSLAPHETEKEEEENKKRPLFKHRLRRTLLGERGSKHEKAIRTHGGAHEWP